MHKLRPSGWRRCTMAFVVVATSLGVIAACNPTKKKPPPPPPAPSDLVINPTSPNFGHASIGDFDSLDIEVINNTTAATGPLALTIQGGDADQFRLVGQGCVGQTLAPGPGFGCSQAMIFLPAKVGLVTSTLVVTASPGGTVTAPLQGTGFQPATQLPQPSFSLEVDQGQAYDCNPPSAPAMCWGVLTGSGLAPFSVVHVVGNGRGFTGTHATVEMDGTVSVDLAIPCNVSLVQAQGTLPTNPPSRTDPTPPLDPPDPCPTGA